MANEYVNMFGSGSDHVLLLLESVLFDAAIASKRVTDALQFLPLSNVDNNAEQVITSGDIPCSFFALNESHVN